MVTRTSPRPGRFVGVDGRMVTCITPTVSPGATALLVVRVQRAPPAVLHDIPVGEVTASTVMAFVIAWRTVTVEPAGSSSPPLFTTRTWYVKGSYAGMRVTPPWVHCVHVPPCRNQISGVP